MGPRSHYPAADELGHTMMGRWARLGTREGRRHQRKTRQRGVGRIAVRHDALASARGMHSGRPARAARRPLAPLPAAPPRRGRPQLLRAAAADTAGNGGRNDRKRPPDHGYRARAWLHRYRQLHSRLPELDRRLATRLPATSGCRPETSGSTELVRRERSCGPALRSWEIAARGRAWDLGPIAARPAAAESPEQRGRFGSNLACISSAASRRRA